MRSRPVLTIALVLSGCVFALVGCQRQPSTEVPALAPVVHELTADQPQQLPVQPVAYVAPDPSDEFFDKGMIPQIKITLTKKEEMQLRASERRYVDCTFTEDGKTTFKKVSMKLKGAAGSFRGLDDRPAITIKMRKKDERFHGMDKFHLNNSVQDESYLCELLCSQICREAGQPAARVTHARVWLNDRDLGFYVLKEGFDQPFLERNFKEAKGNLYDGGFCQDIDGNMEKDEGEGPDDLSDVKALIAACREPDAKKRAALIAEKVDIAAYINFTALELMMSHWDGYNQNRNNYRFYFRGGDKRVVFMPHGMDQMFGDTNASVLHVPGPMVAQAVLQNVETQAKYRERVNELVPLFAPAKLNAKIDAAATRMRPVLAAMHPDRARNFDDRVRDMKSRVAGRQQNIRTQLRGAASLEPLAFKNNVALVTEWEPKPDGDVKIQEQEVGGRVELLIQTGPSNRTNASFRRKVMLAKGTYRFEVRAKPNNVKSEDDPKGKGAGVRLGGGMRTNGIVGTSDWQTVAHEFEVAEERREVELVAELRSTSGSVVFDGGAMKLVKVK